MNLKSVFQLAATAALTFSLAALSFAQTAPVANLTPEQKKDVLDKLEKVITSSAYVPGVDFSGWSKKVESKKADLDKSDSPTAFANTVNVIMREYGLSHVSLFTPEFGTQRITQKRGGLGIRIQIEESGLRVTNVFNDSPAKDSGILIGDLIFECDGKAVKGVAELAGDIGQSSNIKLKRNDKDMTVRITRREYSTVIPETVTWEGRYAVLTIPTFDAGYSIENIDRLMAEIRPRAKGVILDLRGNGGGRVTNLQHLAGYFLDPATQPMGTFINRMNVANYEKEHGPTKDIVKIAESTNFKVRSAKKRGIDPLNVPVAVLVDGGSGSASEMMAAALKELLKAPVIGSKTAGAVLASLIQPLRDESGFWIQYPVMDYVTIMGLRLEGNGVAPDVETPFARFGEVDKAIAEAKVLLEKKVQAESKSGDGFYLSN